MKREFSPVSLALILLLVCVAFRLASCVLPSLLPNISPIMAVSLVGAIYLPRRWGWAVGPAAYLVTEVAFLRVNYLTDGAGSMFSWWTLVSVLVFVAAGCLGMLIARRKSLVKILAGSITCSLAFYLIANTFSWWHSAAAPAGMGYPATLAGWWTANTVGLPGYVPTWTFLRNAIAGDLSFCLLLLLVLDRALLFGAVPRRALARTA